MYIVWILVLKYLNLHWLESNSNSEAVQNKYKSA